MVNISGMLLTEFASKFRAIAAKETRVITVQRDGELPKGEFGFLEFYCSDPHCDCRRVILKVSSTDGRTWATISYGWETTNFYLKWAGGSKSSAGIAGASLDLLNTQSQYAENFLSFFNEMILNDEMYVERLKRHYRMFKDASSN